MFYDPKYTFKTPFKEAGVFMQRYLDFFKFDATATLWGTIYVSQNVVLTVRLRRHELKHLEQIEREGRILFVIKYTYYLLTKGYWLNNYEVEARNAETIIRKGK